MPHWCATAAEQPDPARAPELLGIDWDAQWGDRRQELVFIGIYMDEAAMRGALDAA
jgi:G3E family GTPase